MAAPTSTAQARAQALARTFASRLQYPPTEEWGADYVTTQTNLGGGATWPGLVNQDSSPPTLETLRPVESATPNRPETSTWDDWFTGQE